MGLAIGIFVSCMSMGLLEAVTKPVISVFESKTPELTHWHTIDGELVSAYGSMYYCKVCHPEEKQ